MTKTPTTKSDRVQLIIRVDPALRLKLMAAAAQATVDRGQRTSVNDLVIEVLTHAVDGPRKDQKRR
jgi:predicted HicB family RNase H-like nuclease